MGPFARRAALVVSSLAVCATLIAIAPRAARTAAPPPAEPTAQVVSIERFAAPAPIEAPAPPVDRPRLGANLSPAALAADSPATIADLEALEALPPPPRAVAPRPQAPAAPARIPGYGPRMRGKLITQTPRIDVYVGSGTFDPDDIASVAWKLESLLIQNEAGLYPTKLDRRISIGFYSKGSAPSAGTRGIAYTDAGRIEVYYAPGEDMSAAFTVAAHELAHQLQYQRYGASVHPRSDFIMLEGMATWIAGVRWLKEYGVPSWRGRANQLYNQGIPLQIVGAQRYGADNAYELWASFISFLYKRYGMDVVDELYRSSRGRAVGSADYKGVTGKSLQELTADWREWVKTYEPPPEPTPTPVPATPAPTPVPAGR